jgi:putative phosphoesterase
MKLALIGDVHANLPALEVVLDHAHRQEVEGIWNIGDFVGYGAFPDEVVKRLIKEEALSIIGNYDLKVLKYPKKKKKWRKSKMPQKWFAFKWAYENLSKKSRKYLRTLPEEIRLTEGGKHILLTHGSPASNEEHLTPDTPEQRLRELARMTASEQMPKADVIICGHSHREFIRQVETTWFINTGSVGRPDDGDPRACYAILQLDHQGLQVEHYRLEYDVGRAVAAIRVKGLPEVFAQMLIQGRDLETVLDNQGQ